MDQNYIDSLTEQLEIECKVYGSEVLIESKKINCLVSQSATTKNLQIAGFYKNKTLDLVVPNSDYKPKLNHIVLHKNETEAFTSTLKGFALFLTPLYSFIATKAPIIKAIVISCSATSTDYTHSPDSSRA